jgi:hypothetical protein
VSIGCIGIGDWKPGDCIPGLAITRSGALHLGKGVSSANIFCPQPDGDAPVPKTLGTFRPLRDRYHASTPSFRAYEVFELTRSASGSIRTQGGRRVILLWVGTSAVIPASPRLIGCRGGERLLCVCRRPAAHTEPPTAHTSVIGQTPRASREHPRSAPRTPEAASGSTRSHRASLHTAPILLPPPLISD